jgi:tetratricopeptide (TPR) repeat protein
MNNFDKALGDFNKALRKRPKNTESLFFRGNVRFESGEYKLAIEDYSECINTVENENPSPIYLKTNSLRLNEFYLKRGDSYYYINDFDKAISDFTEANDLKSNCYAITRIGDCFLAKKEFHNAHNYYDQAIKSDSTYCFAFHQKGLCYAKMNNIEKAIEFYKKTITIDSSYSLAYGSLARIYYNMNDYYNCIVYSQKAIKYNTRAVYAMYYIALSNLRLNKVVLAKKMYRIYMKANISLKLKPDQEAIDDLKDLVERDIMKKESSEILKEVFNI